MYKYVGDGTTLPGVPAKDLSDDEARKYGVKLILGSGLYVRESKKPKPKENKQEKSYHETKE
jgi:hypothetical protein